ncbi:hypothetical protein N332_05012, partial [Mesitornis unicolor]
SALNGCVSKASVHDLSAEGGFDLSRLSHQALIQGPQGREVSSAHLATIQIKGNLKMRRMTENLLTSQRGLTDCSDTKIVTLKPGVSKS